MPRKRKNDKEDADRVKKRNRSFRNRERRAKRTDVPKSPDDLGWLKNISIRMAAMKVLNATVDSPHWAYWLSIPSLGRGRNSPTSDFYPCKTINRGDRVWYAFMFREHRDEMVARWPDARKELTPNH